MSCPADLQPYADAYNLELRKKDEQNWTLGIYIKSAVEVAVEHNLMGHKAHSKYIEEPFMHKWDYDNDERYAESREEVAVFEMKQRIKHLRKQGLPESPD